MTLFGEREEKVSLCRGDALKLLLLSLITLITQYLFFLFMTGTENDELHLTNSYLHILVYAYLKYMYI